MRQIQLIMGMPITVEIVDKKVTGSDFSNIFDYFRAIDNQFSTYKKTSEISQINAGKIEPKDYTKNIKTIFNLAQVTKEQTGGYFDIGPIGNCDPSGVVKGWSIQQAAEQLLKQGFKNFYIDAGGDIQTSGHANQKEPWTVGIRNPFNMHEIIKVVKVAGQGVATSGIYERGNHIYNPKNDRKPATEIMSLTVIGTNICDADRFATGAFAMGKKGIDFVEQLPGFEGYMIDKSEIATRTTHFDRYAMVETKV